MLGLHADHAVRQWILIKRLAALCDRHPGRKQNKRRTCHGTPHVSNPRQRRLPPAQTMAEHTAGQLHIPANECTPRVARMADRINNQFGGSDLQASAPMWIPLRGKTAHLARQITYATMRKSLLVKY